MYAVEVINSDPKIIRIFTQYLVEKIKVPVEKIRGQIQIHKGDDKEEIEKFWSLASGIPRSQFNKTIIRPKGNKPGKNRGTFKVRLYDKKVYIRLKTLLDAELGLICQFSMKRSVA